MFEENAVLDRIYRIEAGRKNDLTEGNEGNEGES